MEHFIIMLTNLDDVVDAYQNKQSESKFLERPNWSGFPSCKMWNVLSDIIKNNISLFQNCASWGEVYDKIVDLLNDRGISFAGMYDAVSYISYQIAEEYHMQIDDSTIPIKSGALVFDALKTKKNEVLELLSTHSQKFCELNDNGKIGFILSHPRLIRVVLKYLH